LKDRKCPKCGRELIITKVTRRSPGRMNVCIGTRDGSCYYFIRGFVKNGITEKKHGKV